MRTRLAAAAFAALLLPLLAACSSEMPEPEESTAPSAEVEESAEPSATPEPVDAAPPVDDMYVCGRYMPTASGESGPITTRIISTYTAGSVSIDEVESLYDELVELESRSSSAILASVIGVNQPIRYMHEQIAAENYQFNNQWSALEAMTPLLEDCVAIGYTV